MTAKKQMLDNTSNTPVHLDGQTPSHNFRSDRRSHVYCGYNDSNCLRRTSLFLIPKYNSKVNLFRENVLLNANTWI